MDRAATRPTAPLRRLIRLHDVMARTGLSKTTIWRHIRSGEFPKSVNLTSGTVGWVEEEINDWIDARIDARDALNSPVPARDPISQTLLPARFARSGLLQGGRREVWRGLHQRACSYAGCTMGRGTGALPGGKKLGKQWSHVARRTMTSRRV